MGAALPQEPSTVVDLGKVGRGWSGPATWKWNNPGDQPLEITQIQAGCHCVEPQISEKRIAPSQTVDLTARIRTLSQPEGAVSWKVTAHYREGTEMKKMEFWARAELVGDIICQPTILSFRGTGRATSQLTLKDRRSPGIEVKSAKCNLPGIRVSLSKAAPADNEILVEKLPGHLGSQRGFIVLETNDPAYPTLEVPIHLETSALQKVEAAPAEIRSFGQGSARVILSRPGDQLVRVAKVETPAGLTCKMSKGPGAKMTLEFRQSGPVAAGAKAVVVFENPQLPALELPVGEP